MTRVSSSAFELASLMTQHKIKFRDDLSFDDTPNLIHGKKFTLITKESSSDSRNYFGDIKLALDNYNYIIPVYLKMFLDIEGVHKSVKDSIEMNFKSLIYEAELYKFIFDNIIEKKYSPNFIPYIAHGCYKYDNIEKFIGENELKEGFMSLVQVLNLNARRNINPNINNHKVCLLITEKAGNGKQFNREDAVRTRSLQDWLDGCDPGVMNKLMFQIIYSIACMNLFRINHNDLHASNILVSTFEYPILLCFNVEGEIFEFETKHIPYIFDWDFSYTSLLGKRNPKISYFRNTNLYHNFHPCKDLYTLFCFSNYPNKIADEYKEQKEIKRTVVQEKFKITTKQEQNVKKYLKVFTTAREGINEFDVYKTRVSDLTSKSIGIKDEKLQDLNPKSIIYFYIGKELVVGEDRLFLNFWESYPCRWSTVNKESLPRPIDLLKQKFNEFKVKQINPNSFYYELPSLETIGKDMRDRITNAVRYTEPYLNDEPKYSTFYQDEYLDKLKEEDDTEEDY